MELKELREEVDRIDELITELFVERMSLSGDIAKFKEANGLTVLNRGREREILARVSELAGKDFAGYTRILFQMLFDLSRSHQEKMLSHDSTLAMRIEDTIGRTEDIFPKEAVVACQGAEGANSQIACDKVFSFANIMYFRNFDSVFGAVEKGLCQYGILPIENSAHGSVNAVYDLMGRHQFSIVRSIRLHIDHKLLARAGVSLSDVKEVLSHEQAIGQCQAFLEAHPDIKVTICENTAVAAKQVAESDRTDIAAIASEDCAAIYSLSVIGEDIQDTGNNYTRFIVISKNPEIYPGSNKVSIMFTAGNTPGTLQRILARISSLSLNMTKLESRPIPGTDFQYRFYVDVDADIADPAVRELFGTMEKDVEGFVFLGSYREVQ